MSLISSDTLFHFTGTLENLIGILTNEFRPRLSVETFQHPNQYLASPENLPETGIPMVSFCDIPLSQVAHHMDTYGDYGLGLRKEWGIAKGISPVVYVHGGSPASLYAAELVTLVQRLYEARAPDEFKALGMSAARLVYLLKPYEGPIRRRGKPERNVRFYDEREWRYIPEEIEAIPTISRDDLADPIASRAVRDLVDKLPPLSFDPPDVNYVVVRSDNELLPMYYALRAIKGKYDESTKDLLVTRLVSAERIRADF